MGEVITVVISPDGSTANVDGEGFKDSKCLDYLKEVEKLGVTSNLKKKSEAHRVLATRGVKQRG